MAGVKRVLDLEARVAELETALAEADLRTANAVAEAHREHRRDLVPLHQPGITIYKRGR